MADFWALILFPIITAFLIYNSIPAEGNQSVKFFIIPITIVLLFLWFLTWEWSVVKAIKRVRITGLKLTTFYISLILIFVAFLVPLIFTSIAINGNENGVNALFVSTASLWGSLTWGIVEIVLLAYTSFFCAKTIKTVETKRKAGFIDSFSMFLRRIEPHRKTSRLFLFYYQLLLNHTVHKCLVFFMPFSYTGFFIVPIKL